MMKCFGEIFPVHYDVSFCALICMLLAGGFLPVNIDESMLHHVLVDSCQCIGMHYCAYCWDSNTCKYMLPTESTLM